MREELLLNIKTFFEQNDVPFTPTTLTDPIFESGLDSLDFAALVAKLEIEMGFDPFSQSDLVTYPETLQAFIDCYTAFKK